MQTVKRTAQPGWLEQILGKGGAAEGMSSAGSDVAMMAYIMKLAGTAGAA